MARYTSQEAAAQIGGQYRLVLAAAQRARQLDKNEILSRRKGEGIAVSAIRDIEEGRYTWENYMENFKPIRVANDNNRRNRR
jgi:DNA-directed RNA polymerase omega subunit